MRGFEPGWRLVHAGEPDTDEVIPASYCPVCAPRVLDALLPGHEQQPIAGGAPTAGLARMDFVIEFDREPLDVLVTTSGVANSDAYLRLNRALVADSRFRSGANILVDHTALDMTQLTDADTEEIGASAAAVRTRLGASRVAFVVADSLSCERTNQALAHAQPLEIETRTFYSRADAIAWLLEPRLMGPEHLEVT